MGSLDDGAIKRWRSGDLNENALELVDAMVNVLVALLGGRLFVASGSRAN